MSCDLKPVRCGCGGEAKVRECEPDYENSYLYKYYVECEECGVETPFFDTESEAIEAWNRAMGERTAKVRSEDFLDFCGDCGAMLYYLAKYCYECGARLEWE